MFSKFKGRHRRGGQPDKQGGLPACVPAGPLPRLDRAHGAAVGGPHPAARAARQPVRVPALLLILLVALLQGSIYLWLLPPWQHYDEPSHFEYAWLMTHLGRRPRMGDENRDLRRHLITSMIAHDFYRDLGRPPDPNGDGPLPIGFSALGHPPAYYALVSLPLTLVRGADVTTQLYVARHVSLALFLLTVLAAGGLAGELTGPGHPLRRALPLTVALLPPVADVMTAVNSDVGAVAVGSLFLWGAVQTICRGLNGWRIGWVLGTAALAVFTKNTAIFAVVLAPLVLVLAFWVQRGWSWRWLVGGLVLAGGLAFPLLIGWGDAAHWYRWMGAATQAAPTRIEPPEAPIAGAALLLDAAPAAPEGQERRLLNPVLHEHMAPLAGQPVTVGGWVWASRAAVIAGPGVAAAARPGEAYRAETRPFTVTTTPRFVAWTFDVPANTQALNYVFSAVEQPAGQQATEPLRIFLTGAVLVPGAFPPDVAPVFDDARAQAGTWAGQRFANLVRNAAADETAPRLRPWLVQALDGVVSFGWGRTPAQLLAALWDVERSSGILARAVGFGPLDGLFDGLAWGHVRLDNSALTVLLRGLVTAALAGCLLWAVDRHTPLPGRMPALLLLGLALLLVWGNTGLRALPRLSEGLVTPVARYTFPAILATALVLAGGWWAFWPARLRAGALWLLVGGLMLLNVASMVHAWRFYAGA